MTGGKTMIVFRKELRDAFRDRSTIFSVLVLPLVIYPVMFIGMGLLLADQRQGEERRVAQVAVSGQPRDQLRQLLETYQHRLVAEQLGRRGLDTMLLSPLLVEYRNVASAQRMGGFILGMILPYMIMMLVMVGALHPAIDITAGEKERRTIETLLVCDIDRRQLVAGKLLTAVVMGLVTALMGLCSLGLTVLSGVSILTSGAQRAELALAVSPAGMALAFLTLLPAAVLLASLLLALGCFARSVKEGNSYAQYFMMAVIMLSMVSMTPLEPPRQLYLVPVLSTALCQKELLMGTFNWGHIALSVAANSLLAAVAVGVAVGLFSQERVLFRS